jgi:hypothetical protein
MPLTKLQFKPGINTEVTSYTNERGWRDCDKIRFRFGFPEKMGGWEKYSITSFLGTARYLHAWLALDASEYMAVGTHLKFYVEEGLGFNDITPLRTTTTGSATFSAVNGSTTITVTDNAHGAIAGDYVTFSDAVSLGGNITAAVLNAEYAITEVTSGNTYTFTASATANASDTGDGGASIVAAYQINIGIDTVVAGSGWGAGTWSRGAWGSAASTVAGGASLRIWKGDNFGEDLVFNIRDGGVYYWDKSLKAPTFGRAVTLSSLDSSAPTVARQVSVSDRDRHVIAFGCNPLGSVVQDKLLIRFSDQESATSWEPTTTNSAGDLLIGNGSEIVAAVETRRELIVITDVGAHSMQFIGPPFTFGISQITSGTTIMGPNAAIAVGDSVYWMGKDRFYIYDGQVKALPCAVRDTVFDDFNTSQFSKAYAGSNTAFGEIIFFYPSSGSTTNDRYVVYNYNESIWYFGTLDRTVWLDRGLKTYPVASGTNNYLYNQELGVDDDGSAMTAYIESSPTGFEAGEDYLFIRRLIPDIDFSQSDVSATKEAVFTIKTQRFPGTGFVGSIASTVTNTTEQSFIRARGRSFGLRVESTGLGVGWRLGSSRIDVRADGQR